MKQGCNHLTILLIWNITVRYNIESLTSLRKCIFTSSSIDRYGANNLGSGRQLKLKIVDKYGK